MKNDLGEDVKVFANDNVIFSDIPEGLLSARHNEMNEKAVLKHPQDGQDLPDSYVVDPQDLNDVVDVIIESPIIKTTLDDSQIDLATELEILYIAENPEKEIPDVCKKFIATSEDPSVAIVVNDDTTENVLTKISEGITYIILKWESGVEKKVRLEIGETAEISDRTDPSGFSDPSHTKE